jgi:hypothetical protein
MSDKRASIEAIVKHARFMIETAEVLFNRPNRDAEMFDCIVTILRSTDKLLIAHRTDISEEDLETLGGASYNLQAKLLGIA